MTMYGNPNSLSSVADHYGTNAVFFFYLETVLFLCEKHWNAVLKTLESGVFYTTLYRSVI
jgi:hypothetical protein